MGTLDICPVCGVPLRIGKYIQWNSNGTITQKSDPTHRMLFYECKHLDHLFTGIEDIIGLSIERYIVESKSRSIIQYIKKQKWWPRGALARPLVGYAIKSLTDGARLNGYGVIEVKKIDWRKGYLRCTVTNPYSLPMICGDIRGAFEALLNKTSVLECEEVGPDRYALTCYWAPHAEELAGRLLPVSVEAKPGDYEFERCAGCGIPREISRVRWDFATGTITNDELGVRVALFGARAVQALFDELKSELGGAIDEAIVEAQRRHSLSLAAEQPEFVRQGDLRLAMAVTGLGNLVEVEARSGGHMARVENPSLPLVTVGNALAFYEFITGNRGSASWEIMDDGDLKVELSPATSVDAE